MNLEGKLLSNRYEILEKIGNGGMATVYRATDKILKRQVAVKILRDEFTTDEEFIRRFEVEAQSAARLTHANIVSIYDVGVEGSLYFIVMELIQGKTLKEIIVEEQGPLPWKWSINVAIQIAQALEMAHRNNIIHRDIKPHNIIITEEGVAKVTDFGIAKAVSNSTITAFGTTIGSVHYFSPEHARGGYTDAKSDIYSLGVVMYEMLTGRVPFDADTPVSVALKHMQEEPVEPIELNPNMPSSVNRIIMKCLKKEPSQRYQSSTEMLVDLRAALKDPEGDFVEDVPFDASQRMNTQNKNDKNQNKFIAFIKNHKALCAIIGLILLFVIVFALTTGLLGGPKAKEVSVPNVLGLTKEEAKQKVEEANLVYEEKEEYDKDVEAGKIISMKTEIGDYSKMPITVKVKEGSKIYVIVSKGKEKTKVPNVKGKSKEEATKLIETAKLKAEIVEENSKTVKEGFVISQETQEDTEVFAGDIVKIHVSTGVEKVTMVSVIDLSEDEAKQKLKDLGITNITVTTDENSSKANGVVLKQNIEAGSSVEKDVSITITVNSYVETKTVTLNINVKSITGYTEQTKTNKNSNTNNTDNNTNSSTNGNNNEKTTTKTPQKVTVKTYVDGNLKDTSTSLENNENLSVTVSGTAKSHDIKVEIGNNIKTRSINFATESSVTIK